MITMEKGLLMKVEEHCVDNRCTTGDSSTGIANAGNFEGLEHGPNRNIIVMINHLTAC